MKKIDILNPPNWQIGSKKIITEEFWSELSIREKVFIKLRTIGATELEIMKVLSIKTSHT